MLRKAEISDLTTLTKLAALLWPDNEFDFLRQEIEEMLLDQNAAFFLYFERDIPVGFAQCQLRREYLERTKSTICCGSIIFDYHMLRKTHPFTIIGRDVSMVKGLRGCKSVISRVLA